MKTEMEEMEEILEMLERVESKIDKEASKLESRYDSLPSDSKVRDLAINASYGLRAASKALTATRYGVQSYVDLYEEG